MDWTGVELKKHLTKNSLTAKQLGEIVDRSAGAVQQWVSRGNKPLPKEVWKKLDEVLLPKEEAVTETSTKSSAETGEPLARDVPRIFDMLKEEVVDKIVGAPESLKGQAIGLPAEDMAKFQDFANLSEKSKKAWGVACSSFCEHDTLLKEEVELRARLAAVIGKRLDCKSRVVDAVLDILYNRPEQ